MNVAVSNDVVFICLRNGAAGVAAVLVFHLIGWLLGGRPSAMRPVRQSDRPPASLSPAAVRYIYALGKAELFTGLVANVVAAAIEHRVHIEEKDGLFSVVRDGVPTPGSPQEEMGLIDRLLGAKSRVTFHPTLPMQDIRNALQSLDYELQTKYRGRFFPKSRVMSTASWLLAAMLTVLAVYPLHRCGSDAMIMAVSWLGFACISVLLWALSVYAYTEVKRRKRSGGPSIDTDRVMIGMPIILASGFTAMTTLWYMIGLSGSALPLLVAPILAMWFSRSVIGNRMMIVSPSCREAVSRIAAFKAYLVDKCNKASELGLAHFEQYLPYAIALGVGLEWAERFNSESYAPSWYAGTDRVVNTPVGVASMISTSLVEAVYAAAAPSNAPMGSPSGA